MTMLHEIERFEPAMEREPPRRRSQGLLAISIAAEPFERAPKKSIDYAVLERTNLAAVMPADLGWSDVFSWSSVWEVMDSDAAGNALKARWW
jgi:mannose-1-phosphate guanylyltransferase